MNQNMLRRAFFVCSIAGLLAALSCKGSGQSIVPRLPGTGKSSQEKASVHNANPVGSSDYWNESELIAGSDHEDASLLIKPNVSRRRLSNGLSVHSVKDSKNNISEIMLYIKAGRRDEPPGSKGLSELAANTWIENTRNLTRGDLIRTFDAHGGTLQIAVDFESTQVRCRMISEAKTVCLDLIGSMLGPKRIQEGAIEAEKQRLLMQYRKERLSLPIVSEEWFRVLLWGAKDPRGRLKNFESISQLKEEDVKNWYERFYVANNASIFVSGYYGRQKDIGKKMESVFKRWRSGRQKTSQNLEFKRKQGIHVHIVDLPGSTTTAIKIGSKGANPSESKRQDEIVLGRLLDKAFSFHPTLKNTTEVVVPIMPNIKQSLGMAHGMVINSFLPHEFGLKAVQNVLDVLRNVRSEPEGLEWMKEFLPQVKKELSGNTALVWGDTQDRFYNNAKFAMEKNVVFDLVSFSRKLRDIDVPSMQKTLDRALDPDNLTIVLVGDAEVLRNQFDDAGWKYTFARADQLGTAGLPSKPADDIALTGVGKRRVGGILNRAIKAKGEKILKMKSLSWRGQARLETRQGSVPAVIKRRIIGPDKLRLDMSIQKGMVEVTTVSTATKGWARQKNEKEEQSITMPPDELNALQGQLWRDPEWIMTRLGESNYVYKWLGIESFDGKKSVMIEVKGLGRRVKLYFDAKTALLNGVKYVDKGQSATETYTNYKTINGIKVAHTRKIQNVDSTLRYTIDKVSLNKKISPLIFMQPPEVNKRRKD